MKKIKYLFKRLKEMNYKAFFDTVDEVHKINGKLKIAIFFDIVYCGIKYQAGYMDYKLFEMYRLNREKRKTIVTRGINNEIVRKYNDPKYRIYFSDKIEFNKRFDKYLNRDWMEVNKDNYNEFKEFVKKHNEIIVKPVDGTCGKQIEKIKVTDKNMKKVFDDILNTKRYLIEEVAVQCSEMSSLHPESINTLRVVTLNKKIVACYIRIGTKDNVVDNFNHGGLAAPVNIETGIIDYPAIDKKGNIYKIHPDTNQAILNFKIPYWDKVRKVIIECSKKIPEMQYVGWDVCVGEKPFLIEGNDFPGHDIYQLPPHRTDDIGMLPVLQKAMEE